ncbi:O-succinylbenzoate synthase [marine actinobacterium PHSC20C1]|nr:O-succinylbenzoate synthase [marine actinobacterium PHSC20C1]
MPADDERAAEAAITVVARTDAELSPVDAAAAASLDSAERRAKSIANITNANV